jgi:hypothetical protein
MAVLRICLHRRWHEFDVVLEHDSLSEKPLFFFNGKWCLIVEPVYIKDVNRQ